MHPRGVVVFRHKCRLSNVVGYSSNTLRNGATLATPQFVDVSGSSVAISLDNIKPTGDETSDNVWVKVLDEFGSEIESYCWINWGGDTGDVECWSQDATGDITTGVKFEPGLAFWIQGSTELQAVQSAGQVNTSDVVVQLRNGATLLGNSFPVPVALTDILPTGDELSDNVWLKILDEYGSEIESYCWINWGGDTGDVECWSQDATGDITTGVTFNPGQGFWVQGSSENQFLTFPGVEL